MEITLDFSQFAELLNLPMGTALWRIFFWYFGWFPVACVMLWGLLQLWLYERRHAWGHHQKFILLAIDVPRNNIQSPRSVENMFVYLAGAHNTFSLIEKWWEGKYQLGFSFEIVSIGGYIQFLVHTPAHFRSLVESAVYSQYPDAEIYEVEDYTKIAPDNYPDDEYDIWGAEFIQVADEILPIRTYLEFEHDFGEPETRFRDPMATLMDLMSSLKKGEQLWYQILVIPISQEWTQEVGHFTDHILGKPSKPTKANQFVDSTVDWLSDASEKVYELWGHVEEHGKEAEKALKAHELPPGPKKQMEAAQMKASKQGFEVSIRGLYFARKEVMNKPKAVNGFVGYIKQFNTGDLNSLKPDTKMTMTTANYLFKERRLRHKKNSIMAGYKQRNDHIGRPPWIMNVEELATLWHFPIDAVTKAPLIQRAAGRRIEPPMALPFDEGAKAKSKLEPIFDEGFEVEDETADRHEAEDKPEKKSSKRPGFLEPSFAEASEGEEEMPKTQNAETDSGKEESVSEIPHTDNPIMDPVEPTEEKPRQADKKFEAPAADGETWGQSVLPGKGAPPGNLPFA